MPQECRQTSDCLLGLECSRKHSKFGNKKLCLSKDELNTPLKSKALEEDFFDMVEGEEDVSYVVNGDEDVSDVMVEGE